MTFSDFQKQLPVKLNTQQSDAMLATDGPCLVLAVPGSGKTTMLVARLGYLVLCAGIPPEKILTVTYTVAACRDMSKRFSRFFGEELADRMEFRTINGICAKVILTYGRMIGKTPFSLAGEEEGLSRLLSSIYVEETHNYPTEADLHALRTQITYIKNMLLTPEEIKDLENKTDYPLSAIYTKYCAALRSRSLMDYDDQLVYAYKILKGSPQVLSLFQNTYPYLCVDEAQDTSRIQHEVIKLLASKSKNLFMVGDEDQSIYGFRAAYPQALLDFEKDWPGAKVYLMEENYRSKPDIVSSADSFISGNQFRHPKEMFPSRREREKAISVIKVNNRYGQISYLAKVAEDCQRQTAILYRDNECILPLVDILDSRNIPYNIRSAELTFFSHSTVQDVLDMIRLGQDHSDTEAFMRIYYKLGTYLDKQGALRAVDSCINARIPLDKAIAKDPDISYRVKNNWKETWQTLRSVRSYDAYTALSHLLYQTEYMEYLERSQKSTSKIEILEAISRGKKNATAFTKRLESLKETLSHKEYIPGCPLTLSTIHSSKGLEYDTVFLLDVEDSILPNCPVPMGKAPKEEQMAYEEERRLFYVAVTRAKERLFLFQYGNSSVFRDELLRKKAKGNAYQDYLKSLLPGVRITHNTFGEGTILSCNAAKGVLRVQFSEKTRDLSLKTCYEKDVLAVM